MRSRFGCVTCKQRKLKCDEKKPVCGPCSRAPRRCEYAFGAEFRHFEIPRSSPDGTSNEGDQRSDPDGQVWLDVPRELTFIQVDDPYEDEAIDTSVLPPPINASLPQSRSDSLTRQDVAVSDLSPHLAASSFDDNLSPGDSMPTDPSVIRTYLLWYFKQGPSQWMDLFDTNSYFSGKVSMMAATRPMLLSAACALSAKRISRELDSRRDDGRAQTPRSQSRQTMLNWDKINWHYQTIQFYDEAIRQLKEAMMPDSLDSRIQNGEQFSEDILGVVAIMSMFELMDAPSVEWRAHLGALPLLNEASQTTVDIHYPLDHSRDHGRRSIFWNFARQDVISALVHETQTLLNLEDRALWQRFGLNTGDFGIAMRDQELSHFSPPETWKEDSPAEESVSNALTWILGRIVNFVTSGDSVDPLEFSSPAGRHSMFSISQEALLERWSLLNHDVRRWYQSRPDTFNPCARSKCTTPDSGSDDTEPSFERIWYSIPMCAAAMQNYHMCRILLLMNRPQESTAIRSTVASRLKSYRETERHVLHHSREICGISLSMPPEPVRIHSPQPLFVAGQCFSSPHERQIVLDLLVGVERDFGWASTYYVNKLREEWRRADGLSDLAEQENAGLEFEDDF